MACKFLSYLIVNFNLLHNIAFVDWYHINNPHIKGILDFGYLARTPLKSLICTGSCVIITLHTHICICVYISMYHCAKHIYFTFPISQWPEETDFAIVSRHVLVDFPTILMGWVAYLVGYLFLVYFVLFWNMRYWGAGNIHIVIYKCKCSV